MNTFSIEDLTQYESLTMLCGDLIGVGSTRQVYYNNFDKTKVVKVAKTFAGITANQAEFHIYQSLMSKENLEPYFAKIHYISPVGSLLVQDFYPLVHDGTFKIPTFFGDLKRENFGFNTKTGKIVCLDYAINFVLEENTKLKYKSVKF